MLRDKAVLLAAAALAAAGLELHRHPHWAGQRLPALGSTLPLLQPFQLHQLDQTNPTASTASAAEEVYWVCRMVRYALLEQAQAAGCVCVHVCLDPSASAPKLSATVVLSLLLTKSIATVASESRFCSNRAVLACQARLARNSWNS